MKNHKSNPFRSHAIATAFSVVLLGHFAATSASALNLYWDGDGSTAGFGTAGGTWSSVGTLWDDTQGWSNSTAGTATQSDATYSTTTSDVLFFGVSPGGILAAGTITVSGTVNSGSMTILGATSANNNNLTFTGGTINFGGTSVITATSGSTSANTHTIDSVISGASTSLSVINGYNTMKFGNTANTYTGKTISQGGWLQVAKIGTTGQSSSLGTNGVVQLGASSTSAGQLQLIGVGETTNKQIAMGNNSGTNASLAWVSNTSSDGAALTFSNAAFNIAQSGITGAVTRTVTFRGTNAINVQGVIRNNSTTGLVALAKSETNILTLSGANTYTGTTSVTGGILTLANTAAKSSGSAFSVGGAGTLGLGVGAVSGDYSAANVQTLFNSGTMTGVTMNAASGVAVDTTAGDFTLTGALTGTRALTKLGANTLTTSETNTFTGATTVRAGKLVINGVSVSSLTTVRSGATIGGSGTVAALTIQAGGFHNPGNSPGIMNTGNYINAGTLNTEVTGNSAGIGGYDQVNVTGTVVITGATLATAFSAGSYTYGDLLFILLNDGEDAITGTFSGLAQGATVTTYGGHDWLINYTANSLTNSATGGNDIALLAVPEPNAAMLVGGLGALALLRRRRNG